MPASLKNSLPAPRAKKSLGQHFLRREEICTRIASLLLPRPEDRVLEIGPGPGALTRALEDGPHACLLLLEKDRHWAAERQRLAGPRTQAVLTDALRFDWRRVGPQRPWKIIGNLPYNVASPLIWDIVSRARGLNRAVFMVQKEVAERMVAEPGHKIYGALSVSVQYYTQPQMLFEISPKCFMPAPEVTSAVVAMDVRQQPPVDLIDEKRFFQVVKAAFQQRRKTFSNALKNTGMSKEQIAQVLEKTGIDGKRRGETLSLQEFADIANAWSEIIRG